MNRLRLQHDLPRHGYDIGNKQVMACQHSLVWFASLDIYDRVKTLPFIEDYLGVEHDGRSRGSWAKTMKSGNSRFEYLGRWSSAVWGVHTPSGGKMAGGKLNGRRRMQSKESLPG